MEMIANKLIATIDCKKLFANKLIAKQMIAKTKMIATQVVCKQMFATKNDCNKLLQKLIAKISLQKNTSANVIVAKKDSKKLIAKK